MRQRRPVRRQRDARRREPAKPTDWIQGISALLAVVLAAPALVVAVVTYRDQQEINRAQLEMTRLERQRYDQRFASRVAAWQIREKPWDSKTPVHVRVQNRAPVPIKRLSVEATSDFLLSWPSGPRFFDLNVDIPPCTLMTFDINNMIVPEGESDLPLINVTLWFSDPVGSWKAGPQGVERVDETSRKPVFGYGVELSEERETAADCGEG